MLEDIAVTVGAKVVSEDLGVKLENATTDMLGKASKVLARKESTIIVNGKGGKTAVDKRISALKNKKNLWTQSMIRKKLTRELQNFLVVWLLYG